MQTTRAKKIEQEQTEDTEDAGNSVPSVRSCTIRSHDRNVLQFGAPKTSGGECREVIGVQKPYLLGTSFINIETPWAHERWRLLVGQES